MSKKISLVIASVVLAAALLIGGYFLIFGNNSAPEVGQKNVTIQIIAERADADVDKTFTYDTDLKFVSELLLEKTELEVIASEGTYGLFIESMLGVKADKNSEFFNVKENGVDSMVGVSELPLVDGNTYTFTLTTFN